MVVVDFFLASRFVTGTGIFIKNLLLGCYSSSSSSSSAVAVAVVAALLSFSPTEMGRAGLGQAGLVQFRKRFC